jgi:aldose 1-epimerase
MEATEPDSPHGESDGVHHIGGSRSTGAALEILEIGAAARALRVRDGQGRVRNVVLGHQHQAGYDRGDEYFGAVVGRYANRIAGGRFILGETSYTIPANDGDNALHGGPDGFHRRRWTVSNLSSSSITLELISPAGDQGFPGELRTTVTYTVEDSDVRIDYTATTDAPTLINLTNHSHFNLDGEDTGSIDQHLLHVNADRFTPVDTTLIPTGELRPVDGSVFDFRDSALIGPCIRTPDPQILLSRGLDHNFVVNGHGLRRHATLHSTRSRISLEVLSDQPGVQVYTGNFFDGSVIGTSGGIYRQGAGIALETQNFPDAPNQPTFPSAVLEPDGIYQTTTIWHFSTR